MAAAGQQPSIDLYGLKSGCCRVWSAARGCIEASENAEAGCGSVDHAPKNMPADCAVMMISSGECLEEKDGREDGWNASDGPGGSRLASAVQAAGTLTKVYHHYTATFTATSPTEVFLKTTLTVESSPVLNGDCYGDQGPKY
ncbi:hypothetical protein LTR78_001351 [Recurvomyces mirabilis]|uniref:Uncharacterized protein n=1 Tax=Recurvomyces mirabilis TaxID=574656 RepID=A0AAE1C5J8_9PEZI|nr:hypothetical protein LTR78_001351 [Recurvomyces mirabilis]KAK5161328.1 hypothetical protein LTS14_001124 [Recurvomyces mirabilis]